MSPHRKGQLVAAVIATLSPGDVGKPFTAADRVRARIPHDWQMLAANYEAADIHGVIGGIPHGYFADLLGRAAAAGEQLGLAFAALRDAEVWRDAFVQPEIASHRVIAGRAMAEASGLWAVSAGHAAMNVVARVVRIHNGAASLDEKFDWHGLPKPFDSDRRANLSLNLRTVKSVLAAANKTTQPALVKLVEPLDHLVSGKGWTTLVARRDAGYHRLRPQSIEGGIPPENPWAVDARNNTATLSVGMYSTYVPPELDDLVKEANEGYEALYAAMRLVHDRLPGAVNAAGARVWRTTS